MNHLYEISTGRLISSTTLNIPTVGAGRDKVKITDGSDINGMWNIVTHSFDPRPINTRESGETFWNRFTETEQENLVEAAVTIPKAAALLKAMSYPTIDRADTRIINRVNAMGAAGNLDGDGRTEVILNG